MRPLAFEYDLSQHVDEAEPAMLFGGSTVEELRDWQERFRAKVLSLLGILPERAALVIEFESETDCDTYIRHKIRYQTERDVWVPAYLLVPKGVSATQKSAAILCLHGHGRFGKDSVVGIDDTPERAEEVDRLQYDFGRRFAEQGYVVLAPDLRGFGERQPHYPDPKPDYCCRNYMAATLLGRTVVGYQLCDLHAALDVLAVTCRTSIPTKLAAAGLSYGGRMTMVISAMDDSHQGLRALRLPEHVPGTLPESKTVRLATHPQPVALRRHTGDFFAHRAAPDGHRVGSAG